MNAVFADTVGLLALWNRSDQWHAAAGKAYTQLAAARIPLVTTTFVLLECGNAAARRPYRQSLVRLREKMQAGGFVVAPTDAECESAWMEYARGNPEGPGVVDLTSFAAMRRLGLQRAFTNDRHFRAAGFEPLF